MPLATPGEYLLTNGRVYTMDGALPVADSIAVRGGRIVAVGSESAVRAQIDRSCAVINLAGSTVLPGFIDVHTHVEFIALSRHFWLDVRGISDVDSMIARMQDHARELSESDWLVAQGTFGQMLPSKEQLDREFPDRPVVVRWTMHKFVVNQVALDWSGLHEGTIAPPGMRLRRGEDGMLTGVLEEAWDLLAVPSPPRADLLIAFKETLHSLFLSNGVTTVHEIACSSDGLHTLRELAESRLIPRLGVLVTARPGHQPLTDITREALAALKEESGDAHYWIQGVKVFLDGGRDGAFRADQMGERASTWGLLTRLYPTLAQELAIAAEAGLQVCTHAIGDLAQEVVLSAIEQVRAIHPELDHRFRVEHFFNESRGTSQLERLIAAGGIAVPNPGFVIAEPDDPSMRQPPDTSKYALRTLRKLQGVVPGNSDTAGAQPFTTNPWFTMRCMVELRNKNGVPINPEEVLTIDEALRSFTVDAAFATHQDKLKGRIAPGFMADFAIVDRDPYETAIEELDAMRTLATVIGGEIVNGRIGEYGHTEEVQ